MPVNFQQVYTRVREIAESAHDNKKILEQRRILARQFLAAYGSELEYLYEKVERAKESDANIRCALPLTETLASVYPPPVSVSEATIIAVDGSQVNPDRHTAIQFCVINVGVIAMKLKSGVAPSVTVDTEILYGDELQPNGNPLSDGMVALKRDISERIKVAELSEEIDGSVVTFTDGPIELWGVKGDDPQMHSNFVEEYIRVLSRLQSNGVVMAGYVDKPAANFITRLLEIAAADDDQIRNLKDYHPLLGVTDLWLYGERSNPLIPPGYRSAVFGLQSSSERKYQGAFSLQFFYLNVGTQGNPYPVRVDIPKWVSDDPKKLDLLHRVLIEQCQMMGSRPYPYLLHRAHEIAVVRYEEKDQVEQLLALEFRRFRAEVGDTSNKSSAKALKVHR